MEANGQCSIIIFYQESLHERVWKDRCFMAHEGSDDSDLLEVLIGWCSSEAGRVCVCEERRLVWSVG